MKTDLSREDLRQLQMILEKAKALEADFQGPTFEQGLAELTVLFQSLSFSADPLVAKQAELVDHLHPGMSARHFLNFLLPIERLLDRNLTDPDILVHTQDREPLNEKAKRPLTLVLDNLRSAFNVGSIYRMAETLRAEGILTCGYTPGPDSEGVKKTAMGTERLTPTRHFDRIDAALAELRESGITLIALETSPHATSLYHEPLPPHCAFVVGNERFGLDFHTLKLCDQIRMIPLMGSKNSLNVASALSIACFEWHRQHLEPR